MTGDGVRRYPNGANLQPPRDALLRLDDEIRPLSRALAALRPLAKALPRASDRASAATAIRAIDRLLAADSAERADPGGKGRAAAARIVRGWRR